MEWVETTAKTVEAAKEAALDRLGVAADEAEFEVLDEPRPGLFGRTRGEGRVRARIRPTQVRPKQERKRRTSKSKANGTNGDTDSSTVDDSSDDAAAPPKRARAPRAPRRDDPADADADTDIDGDGDGDGEKTTAPRKRASRSSSKSEDRSSASTTPSKTEQTMTDDERELPPVPPEEVGAAAVLFMDGLVEAFGATGTSNLTVDGIELDVRVSGDELGLLVGPGGRTLNAIQDLARVAAQRRLGDHETRLRIDVAAYRERRSEALQRFAADVACTVRESGSPRALEPMSSADRKVIHDALNDEDGVSSRSEGDDPNRRIVVEPS